MLESLFVFSSSSCWWECVLGLEGTNYKAETGFEFFALDFQDLIPPLSLTAVLSLLYLVHRTQWGGSSPSLQNPGRQ